MSEPIPIDLAGLRVPEYDWLARRNHSKTWNVSLEPGLSFNLDTAATLALIQLLDRCLEEWSEE